MRSRLAHYATGPKDRSSALGLNDTYPTLRKRYLTSVGAPYLEYAMGSNKGEG
jgi:hypothetical protein